MFCLAFIVALLTILYFYLKNINNYWEKRGVQQTKPWLFMGDSWSIIFKRKSFAEMVGDIYNLHPETRYSGFYQFMSPSLLVKDPDLIKQITVKDFDHFVDHRSFVNEDVDPLFGKSLFNLRGKRWRDMRATISPAFTSSKMRYMYVFMKEAADGFVDYFLNQNENSIEVELKDVFTRYTSDVIATTAFGFNVNSLKDPNNEFFKMGTEATNFNKFFKSLKSFLFFMWPKFSTLSGTTFLGKKINDYFTNLIYDSLRQRKEKNIVRMDVIHLLMEAQKGNLKMDEDNSDVNDGFASVKESNVITKSPKIQITDLDIAAQAVVFFFAGFDGVSALMCLVAYELAVNPDIQSKLRDEINETYEHCNGNVTYETVLRMKYLDMVISETLRKWPVAVGTDRICLKPYTIEPKSPDEKPVHLQEGDVVWFSAFGMHRDPKYYPNPEQFDPERFNDENKKNINPYTYIPFGVGPRNCVGSRFALLETKAIFFNLIRNFEIAPSPKMTIPLVLCRNNINIKAKDGYWFYFNRIGKY